MGWALITGAAKKLGAEISRTLAQRGHNIVIHFRSSEKEALEVAKECQSFGVETICIQGDFSTVESTKKFIAAYLKKCPASEILVNNVGNYILKPLTATDVEEWMDLYQTNLNTPFMLTQALLPSLKKAHGSIINIGVAGARNFRANVNAPAYVSSKQALWSMTLSLAKELASCQVRVNMVSPGYLEDAIDLPDDPATLPMGRAAKYREVALAVAFLLNQDSKYITGQNLEIAGAVGL